MFLRNQVIQKKIMENSHTKALESSVLAGNLIEVERLTSNQQLKSYAYYQILEKAITSGQLEVAKLLIRRGCALDDFFIHKEGPQILHIAVKAGDSSLVKLLIKNKADKSAWDEERIPPLFYIVKFFPGDSRCSQLLDCFSKKDFNCNERHGKGFTILHYAAECGNADIIPLLIAKKCQIDNVATHGLTALHVAVKNKHSEVVRVLLKKGANPHLLDKDNMTPLTLAVKNEDIELSRLLINSHPKKRQRKDGNMPKEQLFQRAENKQLVYLATSSGNVPLLKMLLLQGATPIYQDSETGQTALHLAVKKQDIQIVNILLRHNANLTALDKKGFAPFHIACTNGNLEIVSAFLKHSECNLSIRSETHLTPLHVAVREGHIEVINLLLKSGADYEAVGNNGKTVLSCAFENIQKEKTVFSILLTHIRELKQDPTFLMSLEKLVEKYAKLNENGDSILHLAVLKKDKAAVDLILKHNACLDSRNKSGLTAFELATINATVPVVKLFLQKDDKDSFFGDAMRLAIEKGKTNIVRLFLKAGISVDLGKEIGLTPLNLAVQQNDEKMTLLLLTKGAMLCASGRADFETPLFIASEMGSHLVDTLSDVTHPEEWRNGYLSTYIAAYRGHEEIVEILLDAGVNLNSNFGDFLSPLHAAADQGHERIVQLLLENGALVNVQQKFVKDPKDNERDRFFSTPLLAAAHSGHTRIVQLLLENGADFNKQLKTVPRKKNLKSRNQIPEIADYERILTQGNFTNKEIDDGLLNNYTSLHFAVAAKNEEMVRLLISRGANVHFKADNEETVIELAIKTEDENIIKLILSVGPKITFRKYYGGQKGKFFDILKKNVSIADMIVKYIASSETACVFSNVTPLGIAVENGLEMCVKKILESGADVNIQHKRESVLFSALGKDTLEIVKMLLKHGIDLNVRNREGDSPLYIAVKEEYTDIVELLLNTGSRGTINESQDKLKSLDLAISKKNVKIVQMFLKRAFAGSQIDRSFCLALKNSSVKVIEAFLDFGYSVHKPLCDNFPIEYAIDSHNFEVVELLLKKGVSMRDSENNGYLLLHDLLYSRICDERLIRFLIDCGISVNTRCTEDKTPVGILLESICLHYSNLERMKILKLLLLNGADPNEICFFSESKHTALEVAIFEKKDADLVEFLLLNFFDINIPDFCLEIRLHLALRNFDIYCLLISEVTRRQAISKETKMQEITDIRLPCVHLQHKYCQEEIELAKVTHICDGVTYFDILKANHRKLAVLATSDEVKLVLLPGSKVNKMFPCYAKFLIRRIEIGRDRRYLLDSSFSLLQQALRFSFPTLVLEYVFSFLTDRDLRNFCNAFKKEMFL